MSGEKGQFSGKPPPPQTGIADFKWPQCAFWDYSLKTYNRPHVGKACLRLQEEAGADVNLVLLCLWLAARGVAPLPRSQD